MSFHIIKRLPGITNTITRSFTTTHRYIHMMATQKFPYQATNFRLLDHIDIDASELDTFINLTSGKLDYRKAKPSSGSHTSTLPFVYGQKRYASFIHNGPFESKKNKVKKELANFKDTIDVVKQVKEMLQNSVEDLKNFKNQDKEKIKKEVSLWDHNKENHPLLTTVKPSIKSEPCAKNKDPQKQKKVTLYHQVFLPEELDRLRKIHTSKTGKAILKLVIERWNKMTLEEKVQYRDSRGLDKDIYPVRKYNKKNKKRA